MSKYISEHASALADVKAAGAAVEFTLSVPGSYNPITDTTTDPKTVSWAGYAIRRRASSQADRQKYEALKLIESEAPFLFFVPNQCGVLPLLGATATWQDQTYTVRDIDPLAPDGVAIAAYVVVSK